MANGTNRIIYVDQEKVSHPAELVRFEGEQAVIRMVGTDGKPTNYTKTVPNDAILPCKMGEYTQPKSWRRS